VHEGQCSLEGSCSTRAHWRRINDVVAEALGRVSLAEMIRPVPARRARAAIPLALASHGGRA
jgi:DNA-binding IscR family transcriptional regulator